MDGESLMQLEERLQTLEERVSKLEHKRSAASPEELSAKVEKILLTTDDRYLQHVLLELGKGSWPATFAGQPKEALKKIKRCVSSNSWKELVEAWGDGYSGWPNPSDQERFLEIVHVFSNMGEIVTAESLARLEEENRRFKDDLEHEAYIVSLLAEQEDAREAAIARRKKWLEEELADLV